VKIKKTDLVTLGYMILAGSLFIAIGVFIFLTIQQV
jgi:hypothetical protein